MSAIDKVMSFQRWIYEKGFRWPNISGAVGKVQEELAEVAAELGKPEINHNALKEELGDLLLACATLCYYSDVDFEEAIEHANEKFVQRVQRLEHILDTRGQKISHSTIIVRDTFF